VATLHKSHYFNHTVAIDTFYIEWDTERRVVFTILDEFKRYEIDCEIKAETAEMEIGFFESTWSKNFGYAKVLKLDTSSPYQSETYIKWVSNHNIKMEEIPRRSTSPIGHPGAQSYCEALDIGNLQS